MIYEILNLNFQVKRKAGGEESKENKKLKNLPILTSGQSPAQYSSEESSKTEEQTKLAPKEARKEKEAAVQRFGEECGTSSPSPQVLGDVGNLVLKIGLNPEESFTVEMGMESAKGLILVGPLGMMLSKRDGFYFSYRFLNTDAINVRSNIFSTLDCPLPRPELCSAEVRSTMQDLQTCLDELVLEVKLCHGSGRTLATGLWEPSQNIAVPERGEARCEGIVSFCSNEGLLSMDPKIKKPRPELLLSLSVTRVMSPSDQQLLALCEKRSKRGELGNKVS